MKKEVEFYTDDFNKKGGHYSEGHYAYRNEILAEWLKQYEIKNVLEIAGAEGDLARRILLKNGSIRNYLFTDFCPEAITLSHNNNSDPRIHFQLFDADNDEIDFSQFDCFISTSLEHIKNDRKIIQQLNPGSLIVLCLPNFDWGGHIRRFETIENIYDRYADLIDFIRIEKMPCSVNRGTLKGMTYKIRAGLYKYKSKLHKISNILGIEIVGNKKKWNIMGRRNASK